MKKHVIAALFTTIELMGITFIPAMAYEERMPEKSYALHYQCAGGHKVSLTYKSVDDIPSSGWGINDKMMIDGRVYNASYYLKGAQAIVNGVPSYPYFTARNSQQADVGELYMREGSKGHTCLKLR